MTYHIILPGTSGSRTYCGRRAGTPGGTIYPGVPARNLHWFLKHSYPELILKATCQTCWRATEKERKS